MDRYEISGNPVPWAAHKGYGKRSYSIRHKDKEKAQWELKVQHGKRPLHKGKVRVDFFFEMPIPESMSRTLKAKIHEGKKIYHDKRPDRSNLEKHAADCLTRAILHDDNIIVSGWTEKYYSEKPKTIILIQTQDGVQDAFEERKE